MPQINLDNSLGQATPTPQGNIPDVSGLNSGYQAIERLGQIGLEVAGEVEKNRRKLKTAQLTTEASMELQEFVFSLKTDRDYDTQFSRYQDFAKDLSTRYQDRFEGDQQGINSFNLNIGELAYKHGLEVRSQSLNGQMDQQKAGLDLNLRALSQLAVQGDEEQLSTVKDKAKGLIEESYASGVITAEEAAAMAVKFDDELTSSQIQFDIIDNPDKAAERLLNGEYTGITNKQRMGYLEKANNESEARLRAEYAAKDRARQEAERAEKELRETTARNGDKLLFSGDMTTDWLESNKEHLDEQDYRYFYKELTGAEGHTDAITYSDLRSRASEGEDVREDARAALRRGQLKLTDYDKLMNRSEQNTGIGDVPNWFKRGEKYLSDTFRVSDINPDPAASQRRANVLDEWSEWAKENPNPTMAEARKAYQEIAQSYSLIDTSSMTLIKPLPRFAVGNRQSLDIEATMQATVDAFNTKEISQDEFNKQALLLQEWEQAMKQQSRGNNAAEQQ